VSQLPQSYSEIGGDLDIAITTIYALIVLLVTPYVRKSFVGGLGGEVCGDDGTF
jgi:hypothetical protein